MVIPNTCPNLINIVHTDFELGRVIQTVTAADPGITAHGQWLVQKQGGWHTVATMHKERAYCRG